MRHHQIGEKKPQHVSEIQKSRCLCLLWQKTENCMSFWISSYIWQSDNQFKVWQEHLQLPQMSYLWNSFHLILIWKNSLQTNWTIVCNRFYSQMRKLKRLYIINVFRMYYVFKMTKWGLNRWRVEKEMDIGVL